MAASAKIIPLPPPRLGKVAKESTRDKVYHLLRSAILSGRLTSGERLKEIPLAAELGVSRSVLREAMQQLAHEGLVELNSYRGARVILLRPAQIDEIVDARLLLETRAVRLATERITDAEREELLAFDRQLAREADPVRFGQLDFRLHQRLWRIAGNATIEKLLLQLTAPLFAMSLLMRSAEQGRRAPRGGHQALVKAVCGGTPAQAARELERHLTENWTNIRRRVADFLAVQEARHPQAGE